MTIAIGALVKPRIGAMGSGAGLSQNEPANGTGIIRTIYERTALGNPISGLIVGTFFFVQHGNQPLGGEIYQCRDMAILGDAPVGLNIFNNLNLNVVAGDILGFSYTAGALEWDDNSPFPLMCVPPLPAIGAQGRFWDHPTVFGEVSIGTVLLPTQIVTTVPATGINLSQAILNGNLADDGGETCNCGFEWGLDQTYGNTTPTTSQTTGQDFSQIIAGLILGNVYHFRAFATNSAGTIYGSDLTFLALSIPTVDTVPLISAFNGLLNDDGGEVCSCGFEWGPTIAYGNVTATANKNTGDSFSVALPTLLDVTKAYHYRAFATNSTGTSYSADTIFSFKAPAFNKTLSISRKTFGDNGNRPIPAPLPS